MAAIVAPQAHAYLTTQEAAEHLGCTRQWVLQRIGARNVPALLFGGNVRVEARTFVPSAPAPEPVKAVLSVADVAQLWRVSRRTVLRLIALGILRAELRGGRFVLTRRQVLRFLADHTIEVARG